MDKDPSRARGPGKAFVRLADMSVPPDERKRKRKGKGPGQKGVTGQMQHANTPEANKARRAYYKASKRRGREKREMTQPQEAADGKNTRSLMVHPIHEEDS